MTETRPARRPAPPLPVPLAPLPLRERLADVVRFLRRPTPYFQRHAWSRTLLLALLAVFALDFAVDTLAAFITEWLDEGTGAMPDPIAFEMSLTEDIVSALIIAPLLEEAVFRGWLSGRIAALRFGAYGLGAMALVTLEIYVEPQTAMILNIAALALGITGFIQWRARRHYDTEVPEWFTRHFHWFVWGSALAFGMIHLGNYENFTSPLGLMIILPQTVGGLFLAYTRTRFGLRAAMLHHALYNAVLLLMDYEVIPSF